MNEKPDRGVGDYVGGGPGFRAAVQALKLPRRRPTDADRPRPQVLPGRKVRVLPGQLSLEAELERADAREARP